VKGLMTALVISLTTPVNISSSIEVKDTAPRLSLNTQSVGVLQVTSYRSVTEQTDSSPFYTSTGEKVHPFGVALSRDLLKRWGGPFDYGDLVYIDGYGFKIVNDCMAQRHKKAIDIWVETLAQEKKIGVRRANVWLVKRTQQ
jgi:3D (Asp-Asp-Asp) domain-containing protein